MSLDEVIEMLKAEYERAKRLDYVINPLAFALYEVWKAVDRKTKRRNKEDGG